MGLRRENDALEEGGEVEGFLKSARKFPSLLSLESGPSNGHLSFQIFVR